MPTRPLVQYAPFVLLALALGCGQSPGNAPAPTKDTAAQPTAADTTDKTAKSTDSSAPAKALKSAMTDAQIEHAKKQAEYVWKKVGPQVMGRLVTEQLGIFRDSLAKVQAAAAEKKWADARNQIETLVTENKPNEPRLWLALANIAAAMGDPATAERAAMHTTFRQLDQRIRTRGLELLGDLAVKRGDKPRAVVYYRHALSTGPDKAITTKLKALDPKADKAPLADLIGLVPAPIGPAKDIEALCQQLYPAFPAPEKEPRTCAVQAGRSSRATSGALEEAAIVTLTSGDTDSHEILALKGPKGWQAVSYLAYVSKLASLWAKPDTFDLVALELHQVIPDGPEEALVRYTHSIIEDCDPGTNEQERSVRKMLELWQLNGEELQSPVRLPYAMTMSHGVLNPAFETAFDKKLHTTQRLPVEASYEIDLSFTPAGQPKAELKSGTVPKQLDFLLQAPKTKN